MTSVRTALDRAGEVIHEMLDPAFAAGEVEGQIGSHDRPAQSRPVSDRTIDIGDARDPLGDEVDGLSP